MNECFQIEVDQIRQRHFIVIKSVNNLESADISKRAIGRDLGKS